MLRRLHQTRVNSRRKRELAAKLFTVTTHRGKHVGVLRRLGNTKTVTTRRSTVQVGNIMSDQSFPRGLKITGRVGVDGSLEVARLQRPPNKRERQLLLNRPVRRGRSCPITETSKGNKLVSSRLMTTVRVTASTLNRHLCMTHVAFTIERDQDACHGGRGFTVFGTLLGINEGLRVTHHRKKLRRFQRTKFGGQKLPQLRRFSLFFVSVGARSVVTGVHRTGPYRWPRVTHPSSACTRSFCLTNIGWF